MEQADLSSVAAQAKQPLEETLQEQETRKAAGFPTAVIPNSNLGLTRQVVPRMPWQLPYSFFDTVFSYLGNRNPFWQPVNAEKDAVWLLDNTAYQPVMAPGNSAPPWQAEFVAAYFVKGSGKDLSGFVADILQITGLASSVDGETKRQLEGGIATRLQPFLDSILPARTVTVNIGGKGGAMKMLGPGGRNGISADIVGIGGEHEDGSQVQSSAVGIPSVACSTTFAGPTGWAVISDIDDTIKITQTSSPTGILKTTFIDEPQPVDGMPDLYRRLTTALSNPPFWYLSASPYNLYPFLHNFINSTYPHGTIILRDSSWMNLAGLLVSLTQGTQAYKVNRMQKIHAWFPTRKFVCLGDSTQSDPEAYGEVYRTWPKWIGKIFIRKVAGISEADEKAKNSKKRFRMAFEGVPAGVWKVFENPEELYEEVDRLVSPR